MKYSLRAASLETRKEGLITDTKKEVGFFPPLLLVIAAKISTHPRGINIKKRGVYKKEAERGREDEGDD